MNRSTREQARDQCQRELKIDWWAFAAGGRSQSDKGDRRGSLKLVVLPLGQTWSLDFHSNIF